MKKLYQWRAFFDNELIDPPPAGGFDVVSLDDNYQSEEDAFLAAREYENVGGFCDLVLLTVYEMEK